MTVVPPIESTQRIVVGDGLPSEDFFDFLDQIHRRFLPGSPLHDLYTRGFMSVTDGVTAPDARTGKALIYVDGADGDLKVKFADGTVKTLATDT